MPLYSRMIHKSSFTKGPGNAVSYDILNAIDLSHAREVLMEVACTTTDSDAVDVFDVRLQSCSDALAAQAPTGVPGWNDRARTQPFTGDMSASAATPEYYRCAIGQLVDLSAAFEEAYEPSGSLGGAALAVGSVLNGPFPVNPTGPNASRTTTKLPNWRIRYEISGDVDVDASFIGTVTVYAVTEQT